MCQAPIYINNLPENLRYWHMSDRRKILLINAVQQRRIIMGGVLVAILLINSLAILMVFIKPSLLGDIEISQTLALSGLELIIVAAIAYFSLILSHKIAGPAYAIARDLKKLGSGDLTVRTHLRKGDFHTEVAEAFNLTAETLCGKIKTLKASLVILQQQPETQEATRQSLKAVLNELAYFSTEALPPQDHAQGKPVREKSDASILMDMNNPHSSR